MPGPPPPSKSYNLQLDTDTEDEEEKQQQEQQSIRNQQSFSMLQVEEEQRKKDRELEAAATSVLAESLQDSSLGDNNNNNNDDDDDDDDDSTGDDEDNMLIPPRNADDSREVSTSSFDTSESHGTSSIGGSKKKKKRRRKRHKKKGNAKPPSDKNVSFSTVKIRHLERTLGGDGVPSDGGGWPLAVTATVVEDATPLNLSDFEESRQKELHRRWIIHSGQPPPAHIETRQWDYKKDRDKKGNAVRNPVFGALSEEQRHNLLVSGSSSTKSSSNKSHSGSPPRKSGGGLFQRLRARSMSESENTGPYDSVYVRHVRNELEDLRVARTKAGNIGCECRKVHVHLPKLGHGSHGGGKHHKRMSMPKVKEELRKRHALPTLQTTRDKLEQLLHSMVQTEPCCSSTSHCPCVQNGLQCQADTCSCWSHGSVLGGNKKPGTVKELQEACGNENGMYVVDFNVISKFRKDMINDYACQVIEDKMTAAD